MITFIVYYMLRPFLQNMTILLVILWLILGIIIVAKIAISYEDFPQDGPIANFVDQADESWNELAFFTLIISIIVLSVILWPLTIIYQLPVFKSSKKEMLAQPRE